MASSKNNEDQKYTYFYKIVYWIDSLFSADENVYFLEKKQQVNILRRGKYLSYNYK